MELNSQKIRKLAPENDPLKIGMGWMVEDLEKPQIMVESSFGDSHPGSAHLNIFVEEAMRGIRDAGGKGARYYTTDMCDGIAQGHDSINYSLVHRDMIANMIEIHGNSTGFDGGIFIASCDKSVPACLMGLCRLDMPSIVITGGVMDAGPDLLTLEQIGAYSAMCQRGEITPEKLTYYKQHACPSCGACSFMGTASTMQIMAEALGLMLPGSALMPATCEDLKKVAYQAGVQVMELAKAGIKVSDIVTMKSFENAIMVHAAISGSTNSLLHIPAIAHELGFEIDGDTFDRMHRGAHYLLDIRPAGKWPAQFFYYAGGVQTVLKARPFDCEEDAIEAVLSHKIQPGDAVFIRYEGPKGSGMPEMFYTTEAIASDPELGKTIALITDGRFSGASKDPAIGHVSPEAADGGPIALVEEDDLIKIDIPKRVLEIVGVNGKELSEGKIELILEERKKNWSSKKNKYTKGVLKIYSEHAVSPMRGGYME